MAKQSALFNFHAKQSAVFKKHTNPKRSSAFAHTSYDTVSEINTSQARKNMHILNYFLNFSGFQKPYKVVLDTTVVYHNSLVSLVESVSDILDDENVEFYTTSCCVNEMKSLSNLNETSDVRSNMIRALSEIETIPKLQCTHGKTFDSKCIQMLIGEYNDQKLVVVTASNTLWLNWYDSSIVPVIVQQKGGPPILKSLSCFVKSPDYARLMADYERLNIKLKDFQAIEIDVGVGANTQFSAIYHQLRKMGHKKVGHKKEGHQEVREAIIDQIRKNENVYKRIYDGDFSVFMKNLPSQETWGERTTLQAAADFYSVKIVVMSSSEDPYFSEWLPRNLINSANVKVIFISYLEGYRYSALHLYRESVMQPFQFQLQKVLSVGYDYRRIGVKLVPPPERYVAKGTWGTTNEKRLRDTLVLRLQTYQVKEREVDGDGNCTFRAIADQVYGYQNKHKKVRAEICAQFDSYPEKYRDAVFSDYVENMSQLKTWADGPVLQSCADVYNCRVFTLGCYDGESAYLFGPRGPDGSELDCSRAIYLTDSGSHNNSMCIVEHNPLKPKYRPKCRPKPKP